MNNNLADIMTAKLIDHTENHRVPFYAENLCGKLEQRVGKP